MIMNYTTEMIASGLITTGRRRPRIADARAARIRKMRRGMRVRGHAYAHAHMWDRCDLAFAPDRRDRGAWYRVAMNFIVGAKEYLHPEVICTEAVAHFAVFCE